MDFDCYVRVMFSIPAFITVNMQISSFQVVFNLLILGNYISKKFFCICFCSIICLIL